MATATETSGRVRALSRATDIQDIAAALDELRQAARNRPYPVMAAATAVGFVLGGGLTVQLAASLLGAGARAAALGVVSGFASRRRALLG